MEEKTETQATVVTMTSSVGNIPIIVCGCGSLLFEPAKDKHLSVCLIMAGVRSVKWEPDEDGDNQEND